MTRLGGLAAALLAVASSGCEAGAESRILPLFERACVAGGECPGRKCVRVAFNAQGVGGVCSAPCASNLDCGEGAACFSLGDAGSSCLSRCSDASPCEGGLACVAVGAAGERACYVAPAD